MGFTFAASHCRVQREGQGRVSAQPSGTADVGNQRGGEGGPKRARPRELGQGEREGVAGGRRRRRGRSHLEPEPQAVARRRARGLHLPRSVLDLGEAATVRRDR